MNETMVTLPMSFNVLVQIGLVLLCMSIIPVYPYPCKWHTYMFYDVNETGWGMLCA